jgi:hypothetical protein
VTWRNHGAYTSALFSISAWQLISKLYAFDVSLNEICLVCKTTENPFILTAEKFYVRHFFIHVWSIVLRKNPETQHASLLRGSKYWQGVAQFLFYFLFTFFEKYYTATARVVAGYALSQLVGALRYKPEGRGFSSWWCIGIFHWHNPFGRSMILGSHQPITEIGTRNISWGIKAAGV